MNNFQLVVFFALLAVDMVFTAIRASLLNVRYPRLIALQEAGKTRVDKTIELVTRRARTRSTLKLGQMLLRLCLAGILMLYWLLPDVSADQAGILFGYLILIGIAIWLLEFILERLILQDPEGWSVRLTPLANLLVMLFSPLLFLPLRLSRAGESRNLVTITEEELIHLVDASQQAGEIEVDEREMIHSVFEFGDTLAKEIMIPRVDMLALEVNTPLEDAADLLLNSGFSRVPVYEGQIDNIIGMLYTKDMLQVWRSGNGITSLRTLLRPARFIPETKKVDELLDEIQAARIHIAIVVDEYGGVAGLVTLEDIIEEIFGEIEDEYDENEEELWREIGPGEYLFDGRMLLEDINELLNTDLSTEDADTIGGLVFARVGRVPLEGDTLREENLVLSVDELHNRRVHKVRVELPTRIEIEKDEDQDGAH